ncbi:hypothetical protein [Psychromonas sp. Urea-02u-13]|uniref:hypothetical protein n=1 Tax=Psychromonas sp. Urea-02u-13 TaxID=2058326 RepID=UPI000C32D19F|nr:hypothetical protein [Psychromonas sp. Urea-02u-13]PKG39490.1 hypothetical protein CXF74_07970 [Psychromonas sp. Urea-02u-13]
MNNMLNASGITARAAQLFPSNVLQEMYMSLDSDSEFQHAGVIFEYEKNRIGKLSVNPGSLILSPSSHYDKKTLRESCRADGKIIYIREVSFPKHVPNHKRVELVKSTLWEESKSTMISCAGAGSGWVLLFAEAGGGGASFGATWAAMPLTLASTSAATFQCGTGIGRVINEVNGNSEYNQWLDSSPTFATVMFALDVVQVADLAKAGLDSTSLYFKFKQNKAFGQNKLLKMYKGMTRANRKKLAEEILKINNPKLLKNQKLLKEVIRGKKLLDDGTRATKVYSQVQVQKLIRSTFYKSFLSKTVIATGVGSAATIHGSVKNLPSKVQNSINYVIGITTKA